MSDTPLIYHITDRDAWAQAATTGEYRADSLATQGFIHCSTLAQVIRVANAVYAGHDGLVLLEVEPAHLSAPLRYEPPDTTIPAQHYSGELFPHLYGALPVTAVRRVLPFPCMADGTFTLPAELR